MNSLAGPTTIIEVLVPDGQPDPVARGWYDELELAACYLQGVPRSGDVDIARQVILEGIRVVMGMLNDLQARILQNGQEEVR